MCVLIELMKKVVCFMFRLFSSGVIFGKLLVLKWFDSMMWLWILIW